MSTEFVNSTNKRNQNWHKNKKPKANLIIKMLLHNKNVFTARKQANQMIVSKCTGERQLDNFTQLPTLYRAGCQTEHAQHKHTNTHNTRHTYKHKTRAHTRCVGPLFWRMRNTHAR